MVDQKWSMLTWASAMVVAVMVRHHRPQQNFTPHSTAPLRFPRPGRARGDDGPVVLGHRGEAGLHIGGAGHDHRGQAVGAPLPGGAAQAPHHRVHGLDEMGLVHRLGQHPAGASPSATACRGVHRRSRPTGPSAARTSPTGSPRRRGGRSRWSPGPSPPSTPRSAGAARPAGSGGRSSHRTRDTRGRPPRRTGPRPTGAGRRRTGRPRRPGTRRAGRARPERRTPGVRSPDR